ncbi:MAG: hypothetical protein [Circular genetic element sp.]|nr:MAG: hypothetical protein [Circular genetic element sp.]
MTDMPFQIKKTVNGGRFIYDGVAETWNVDVGNNWTKVSGNTFLSEERLDIAGLSKQELTLFFGSQRLQRSTAYQTSITASPAGGGRVVDVFIVSDVPLQDVGALGTLSLGTSMEAGFSASPDDALNTKFAQGKVVVQSTNTPLIMIEADAWDFGSNDPTASDCLYLYRWIALVTSGIPQNLDTTTIPDLRYIATGITTKESDLIHINRLRLSYEQQQRV